MKVRSLISSALLCAALLACAGAVEAQTAPPGTRATPCDPLTPNNAICVQITPSTTTTDGATNTLPLTFRVEQQFNGGAWTQSATGLTTPRYYAKNLPIGSYVFRVYENCSPNCTESLPTASNAKDATVPIVQPNPPGAVLVVRVTISSDRAPVYRILGSGPYTRGSEYGYVPVGRECERDVVFQYRGLKFRRVKVESNELWGTTDASRLAAPCA
jgi:hypothetical protein